MTNFKDKYDPWALITGVSSGIGAEFARQVAAQGLNLVLVARREARLRSLARALETAHPIHVKVLADGLHVELKPAGVDVLALTPGFAATDLAGDFDFSGSPIKPMRVEPVVQAAPQELGRRSLVIPGWQNRFLYWMVKRVLPRPANTVFFGKIFGTC